MNKASKWYIVLLPALFGKELQRRLGNITPQILENMCLFPKRRSEFRDQRAVSAFSYNCCKYLLACGLSFHIFCDVFEKWLLILI